jgi:cystathionine beta-lyase
MQDITGLIHHPYQAPAGFEAPQPGVFKASTVFFPNVAAMRAREWKDKTAYTYGLHGTPTTYLLEERLCALEGGQQCLLVPSGLAAIALVSLSLLQAGDEVLIPDNAYGPNKSLAAAELQQWGITHRYYNPMDAADLAAKISPATRLVWLEVPGSVTLEFPDLPALVQVCRARGVVSALDNTWGAGLAFKPFDHGVDLTIHALTKYPSGGGDVLMGSVITRDEALHLRLKLTHMRLGLGVGANDVEAVLRALPSIELRYRAQDQACRALALWLQAQTEVAQVLHPALPGSPGHAHWQTLCTSGLAAGLLSIVFKPEFSSAQVDAFCDALKLFRIGYSWGGPISLVVPYDIASMRTLNMATGVTADKMSCIRSGTVVRLAIGLEDVRDLQADLAQALQALKSLRA